MDHGVRGSPGRLSSSSARRLLSVKPSWSSAVPGKQKAPEVSGLRGSQRSHCNVRLPRRLYAEIADDGLAGVTFGNLRHRRFHTCHDRARKPCPTHGKTRHAAQGAVGWGVKLGLMVEHGSKSTVNTSFAGESYTISRAVENIDVYMTLRQRECYRNNLGIAGLTLQRNLVSVSKHPELSEALLPDSRALTRRIRRVRSENLSSRATRGADLRSWCALSFDPSFVGLFQADLRSRR